jgi:hypothetical protein
MMAVVAMPRPTCRPMMSCCMGSVKPSAASGSRPSWPIKALSTSWKVISDSTPKSMGQVMVNNWRGRLACGVAFVTLVASVPGVLLGGRF